MCLIKLSTQIFHHYFAVIFLTFNKNNLDHSIFDIFVDIWATCCGDIYRHKNCSNKVNLNSNRIKYFNLCALQKLSNKHNLFYCIWKCNKLCLWTWKCDAFLCFTLPANWYILHLKNIDGNNLMRVWIACIITITVANEIPNCMFIQI